MSVLLSVGNAFHLLMETCDLEGGEQRWSEEKLENGELPDQVRIIPPLVGQYS